MKQIEVVAAIIFDKNKILATQRGYGEFKDWWEFPGGKIEIGETREEALQREINEELGIDINIESFIKTIEYDYPKFHLTMHCYKCSLQNSYPKMLEHEAFQWLEKEKIDELNWLPADLEIIEKLKEMLYN